MLVDRPAAVVSGFAAHRIARDLRRLEARGEYDGMHTATRAEIAEAIREVEAAGQAWYAARARKSEITDLPIAAPSSQEISVTEAAHVLGVSTRRIRQLAPLLGAKVAGRWVLDPDAVAGLAQARKIA